jgi:transposase
VEQVTTTVGIDIAKRVFALHGVDQSGRVVLRRTVRRDQLMEVVASLSPCLIGMEAGSGAHEWARRFQRFGHTVRLMAATFVLPYRRSGKNDGNDAEAICEAVSRPGMRFVPVKSAEQQAVLTLHRARQGFVEERTSTINRIRGLMAEFGEVLPLRAETIRRQALELAQSLPALARTTIHDLCTHLRYLDERIAGYDAQIRAQAELSAPAQRLMKIRGIGPLSALALVATAGDARDFKSGRQFAAWLGLTPKQHSSGGKNRLGSITKRGDAYVRTLLVLGARSVLNTALRHKDRMSRWVVALQIRRGYHRALIAIANKNARIAWALLSRHQDYRAIQQSGQRR